MAALVEILSVILIILLILFEKVSLKLAFSSPFRYKLELLLFSFEGIGGKRDGKKRLRFKKILGGFSRIRHRFFGLRYLIRHASVERSREENYDIVIRFYLFRLCIAALVILKNRVKAKIKRRIKNVGK